MVQALKHVAMTVGQSEDMEEELRRMYIEEVTQGPDSLGRALEEESSSEESDWETASEQDLTDEEADEAWEAWNPTDPFEVALRNAVEKVIESQQRD